MKLSTGIKDYDIDLEGGFEKQTLSYVIAETPFLAEDFSLSLGCEFVKNNHQGVVLSLSEGYHKQFKALSNLSKEPIDTIKKNLDKFFNSDKHLALKKHKIYDKLSFIQVKKSGHSQEVINIIDDFIINNNQIDFIVIDDPEDLFIDFGSLKTFLLEISSRPIHIIMNSSFKRYADSKFKIGHICHNILKIESTIINNNEIKLNVIKNRYKYGSSIYNLVINEDTVNYIDPSNIFINKILIKYNMDKSFS